MLIQLADGKTIEPGKGRRNYVDADGTLYTVWVKWVGGQCIYRPHKRVNGSYRVVPDTKWHQTEQAAQAELDIEASVQGWREIQDLVPKDGKEKKGGLTMHKKIKALQNTWNALSFEARLIIFLDCIVLICTAINVKRLLQML